MVSVMYLVCNRVAPAYDGKELGIGDSFLIKAIERATGRSHEHVKKQYQDVGDLGLVAQSSK